MTAWLLVTASRKHGPKTRHIIVAALTEAGQHLGRDTVLVHGDQGNVDGTRGGDRIAAAVWTGWGLTAEAHPADWDGDCQPDHPAVPCPAKPHRLAHRWKPGTYCPLAGNRRNDRMVQQVAGLQLLGDRALCLSMPLPGSTGTPDCTRRAKRAGIEVWPRWDPAVAP